MRYLLDTCALSELRRPKPDAGLVAFIHHARSEDLFISALTVGEITKGIERLDEGARKQALRQWLARLEADYGPQHILNIDGETARIWGLLTANTQNAGRSLPAIDGLIAATAMQHGLHIVTRNVSDFSETGALLVNPWLG